MSKQGTIFIFLIFLSAYVFGDPVTLQAYRQRFTNSNLAGKEDILRSAAFDARLDNYAWQLYDMALQYAVDNYSIVDDISEWDNIIILSVRGLRGSNRTDKLDFLWKLFLDHPHSNVRSEILITLGDLGKKNQTVVNNLNNFLLEQTEAFKSGENVNYTIISACISALLELNDSSSYPSLFGVLLAGYPEIIIFEAFGAMDLINGNLQQFFYNIIQRNEPDEKFVAFRAAMNSERLSASERGRLAELALSQALSASQVLYASQELSASEENVYFTGLRYASVLALTSLRWTRANALAVRHYYLVHTDYLLDNVSKDRFLEAIACLGAVGNSDAALVLGLQLGLINARTESTGIYDPEITQSIIEALGLIGDNAAFDHLLHASYLPYSEDIRFAASEAIDRLKW